MSARYVDAEDYFLNPSLCAKHRISQARHQSHLLPVPEVVHCCADFWILHCLPVLVPREYWAVQVALDGSPAVGGIKEALLFPDCADLQPLAYVQGLAKAVEKLGGRIYENTRVMNTDKTYVRADAIQHPPRNPSAAAMCW